MAKLAILIVIVLLGVLALFSMVNNDMTTINVPFSKTYEISKIGLMLASTAAGAVSMLIILMIRDTRRYVAAYQYQKQKKREEKLQTLYSRALNAILANDEVYARGALDEIIKEDPGHTDALLRLGDIAAGKENMEEAFGFFSRAHQSEPRNIECLFSLANSLEALKRYNEAMNALEDILEIDPDNLSALYRKRALLERKGKWDEVLDVQKTILKYENVDEDKEREQANLLGFRYERARASLERGEYEKASKGFKAILKEEKDFIPAHLGLAEVRTAENESEAAVSVLEKAYEQTHSQIILARLEDLLINLGEPARLIRTFRRAISETPQNNEIKLFLGKLFFRLEMIEDAFDVLSSLDIADAYPEYYSLMGELHLRRGQCDKAVAEFKRSLGLKKTFRMPYCCGVCGRMEPEWSGRCPGCGNWSTFRFNLHGHCKG